MSVGRGRWGWAIAMAALAAIGACAPYPAATPPGGSTATPNTPGGSTVSRPAPGSTSTTGRAGSTATGGRATTSAPDTVVTRDATEVLASIPEPLSATERVPAPDVAPPRTVVGAPTTPAPSGSSPGAAAPDTTAAPDAADSSGTRPGTIPETDTAATAPPDTSAGAADEGEAAIPIPSPTYALGLEPPRPPDTTAADTTGAAGAAASPSTPSRTGSAPATSPAGRPAGPPAGLMGGSAPRDTCWRVQVGAPDDKTKGDNVRSASESLLLIPMVVEREGGLYKVRTRDCLSRTTAEALKRRAEQSGFKGSFRFVGRRP